jgi:ATP-dependent RNA helicase RhlE
MPCECEHIFHPESFNKFPEKLELFIVKKEAKLRLLDKILAQYHGATLLFSRTKHNARKIAKGIRDLGHSAIEMHSNRSLAQRREALQGFKSGKYRVLVATDIAARGIDVKDITHVVNYSQPQTYQDYTHRVGRAGRAGNTGYALTFVEG